MSVTININGENAAEVLQELQGLAAGLGGNKDPLREPAPNQEEKTEAKPARRSAAKKTEPKKESPETATVSEDDTTVNAAEDTPTIEEIRAKAQAIKDKAAVKALIEEFEAKNLTTIPEDRRAEFLARLEEL